MRNYEAWHNLKKHLENQDISAIRFREQEIWWCALGANIGSEEDGNNEFFERPVLIIRKFNHEMFWGIPLTSTLKEHEYYHTIELGGTKRSIILSQIRMLSSKRLIRRMTKISDLKFEKVSRDLQHIGFETKKRTPLQESSSA